MSYVADIDGVAFLHTSGGVVGERVGRHRGITGVVNTAAAIAAATSVAESAAAATKSSSTITASEGSAAAGETAAAVATRAHARAGEAIFTDLKHAALPVIAVELLNGVAGVFRSLKNHNTRALRSAVWAEMDVGANNATCAGYSR